MSPEHKRDLRERIAESTGGPVAWLLVTERNGIIRRRLFSDCEADEARLDMESYRRIGTAAELFPLALLDTADSGWLDWMETHVAEITNDGLTNEVVLAYLDVDGYRRTVRAPTLRAAIDAARQADHDD